MKQPLTRPKRFSDAQTAFAGGKDCSGTALLRLCSDLSSAEQACLPAGTQAGGTRGGELFSLFKGWKV